MNSSTTTAPLCLRDYPLWRLLVMLFDAEQLAGADSDAARAIAREIEARLQRRSADEKEARCSPR